MGRTRNGRKPQASWDPLERAYWPAGSQPAVEEETKGARTYRNRLYTVTATPVDPEAGMAGWVHLSLKRNDRAAVRDWRHMQRLKNEVVGPEREAVELYPAESRLVDEANQYHLWVFPEGDQAPIGFEERMVGSPALAAASGARQRAFDEDVEALDDHEHAPFLTMRRPIVE
jgi:hypothetical protein